MHIKQEYADHLAEAMFSGDYVCPKCGGRMELEDPMGDTLYCTECHFDTDFDGYACSGNYDDLYEYDDEDFEDEDSMTEEEKLEEWYYNNPGI